MKVKSTKKIFRIARSIMSYAEVYGDKTIKDLFLEISYSLLTNITPESPVEKLQLQQAIEKFMETENKILLERANKEAK